MEIDREAIIKTYLAESLEHLSGMEEALVMLEEQPEDEKTIEAIFRVAHTLKGNASSLGFTEVAEFAHAVEDVLERLRNRTLRVESGLVTLLLQAVDALRQMVPGAIAGEGPQPAHMRLLKQLTGQTLMVLSEGKASPNPTAGESRRRPFGRRRQDAQAWAESRRTLRVDIDKLDRMLDLTGEIAIAQGRFRQMLQERNGAMEEILEAHRQADILFLDLQEQIMKIRMVPVGPMFRQYIRVVRDMAQAHGKRSRLIIEGGDVEVDTTVIEHLRDPLTHMIRNAVDHGIESPETRKAAGKDPSGSIVLRAFHDAGSIVIQLEDDGAGLNRDRILQTALSRGMVSESQRLSDEEIYRFIFEPGFTTAETVSDLSGRGVGMDVVRRNIDALRGTIAIDSRPGAGTTITIRLPLTLAIIEGFAVGVEGETYVIPLDTVLECHDLPEEERERIDGDGVINLRGKPLPYLRLRDFFGLRGSAPQRESVLVVQHQGGQAGLVVDALYGERQAVIKPLGRLLYGLQGVSGFTILGNGQVALILDIPALLKEVVGRQMQMTERCNERGL